MKTFWNDRIAIATALVGVILMILAITWRINPVEGSVVPEFLRDNPIGRTVGNILFITCMPAWIAGVYLTMLLLLPFPKHNVYMDSFFYIHSCGAMLIIQGMLYFMIGKLISFCVRKFSRKKAASNQAMS